jgi:uncharacterized membrane protein
MPTVLAHAVQGWTDLYSHTALVRTLVAFAHVAGLVAGGGAAIAADRATLKATRRGQLVAREQLDAIHNTHRVVIAGLVTVIVSGILLFAADVDTYSSSRVFWLKMGMVAALMINGALLVRVGRTPVVPDASIRRALRRMTAVSMTLWFLTTLAGAALPNIG